jgi:hypothetical protein
MRPNIQRPLRVIRDRVEPARLAMSGTPIYPRFIRGQTKWRGQISAVLMGQSCGYAVARLVAPTLARISRDADRNAGLHNDRTCLARGSGRSANAVPGTGATAQRGPEAWKEAMRVPSSERCAALYQASLAAEATLNYANDNRKSCDISVPMLNQVEGYRREAVQARDNACAGRPLRPYPADIIQR